jgi:biofilm protein TabA
MIYSDKTNWQREKHVYPKAVNRGLEYIQSTDFSNLEVGKYEIEGSLMFVMVQGPTTKDWQEQRPESHQTYTDIQYLLSGEEMIRVASLTKDAVISEEHFAERDVAFYSKVAEESVLYLKPDDFAVFYPGDIHRPCCSVKGDREIRKVVVKIHNSLLSE